MMQRSEPLIREMERRDIPAVAQLERECFSDPWSVGMIEEELLNPLCRMYVAELDGDVAGYAGMQVILGEGYITNVAVASAARRRGLGAALIRRLIQGEPEPLEFVTLEVRASNLPAIALYEGFGFKQVGLRPGYYNHPTEDALLMTLYMTQNEK